GITLFCIFVPELIFFIFHDNYREKLFFSTAVGHTPSTAVFFSYFGCSCQLELAGRLMPPHISYGMRGA
ncbi:MAG: hypothetical protein LBH84_04965, partial [Prevotellaceae bacterium]|nr:hypothetical protein [Prevotellaceae bacterium]